MILYPKEVADRLRVSTRTLLRWRKTGRLPTPIRLPSGRVAWHEEAIEQYIQREEEK